MEHRRTFWQRLLKNWKPCVSRPWTQFKPCQRRSGWRCGTSSDTFMRGRRTHRMNLTVTRKTVNCRDVIVIDFHFPDGSFFAFGSFILPYSLHLAVGSPSKNIIIVLPRGPLPQDTAQGSERIELSH